MSEDKKITFEIPDISGAAKSLQDASAAVEIFSAAALAMNLSAFPHPSSLPVYPFPAGRTVKNKSHPKDRLEDLEKARREKIAKARRKMEKKSRRRNR